MQGAEDFNAEEEVFEVTTTVEDFSSVRDALESREYSFISAELSMIPDVISQVNSEDCSKVPKVNRYP